MSRKNKLKKFNDILSFPNVYECYNVLQPALVGVGMEPVDLRGRWRRGHFGNDFPITLELACGGGEYTVGLAASISERNFIGIDIKGNRIWKGAKQALEEGVDRVAFLRTRIEVLAHFFAPGEVDEIWITFADPFPRPTKADRRLSSARFLEVYRRLLKPGGLVHVKHDDPDFYRFTLNTIAADPGCVLEYCNDDIYAGPLERPELAIQTTYERMHLAKGKKIKYLRFSLWPRPEMPGSGESGQE